MNQIKNIQLDAARLYSANLRFSDPCAFLRELIEYVLCVTCKKIGNVNWCFVRLTSDTPIIVTERWIGKLSYQRKFAATKIIAKLNTLFPEFKLTDQFNPNADLSDLKKICDCLSRVENQTKKDYISKINQYVMKNRCKPPIYTHHTDKKTISLKIVNGNKTVLKISANATSNYLQKNKHHIAKLAVECLRL